MKHIVFTLILIICFVSCDLNRLGHDENTEIPLTRSEQSYAEISKDFALELLQMYYDKRGEAYDFVFSPISLQMFFGMLSASASEEQAAQINEMLGYEGSCAEGINSFCKKVLETSPKLDSKVTVDVANQWWLNSASGFKLFPTFAQMLKEYYQVEPEARDFATEPMYEITRSWVWNHTRGMIDYGCQPPYSQSILANVTYFKAEWKEPFDGTQSMTGDFFREDGSITKVKYMKKSFKTAELYVDNTFQALYLPFGSGAFRMEFYLPREGKYIRDVISELQSGSFPKAGELGSLPVTLPSFDLLCSNNNLVRDIYNHFRVSLSARYPLCGEDQNGEGFGVSSIAHIARIKVLEEGAEAAAVTMNNIISMPPPNPREFSATRPFVFIIREVGSGIVFFSGVYAGGIQ